MPKLSIVAPVYACGELVLRVADEVVAAVRPLVGADFELILVDDGSPDAAWLRIQEAAARYPQVMGVQLSRNFGQQAAILAGLAQATSEWIVVMDCDLQDRPDQIPQLYQLAQSGNWDVVFAQRQNRQDPWAKRATSWLFFRVLSWLTGTPQDASIGNFGIYHRHVVVNVLALPEHFRSFPIQVRWVGFRQTKVPVPAGQRPSGRSGYSWRKLLRLGLDVILSNSERPIHLTVLLGVGMSVVAFFYAAVLLLRALRGDFQVSGYASIMVSIWFLAGLVILIIGVVGLYVGKTFQAVQQRPSYLVRQVLRSTTHADA